MKVVINTCCGTFNLSEAGRKRYMELSGSRAENWLAMDRTDKYLVQVVEELGYEACGGFADLKVVDVEPGRWFRIEELPTGAERIMYRDNDDDWLLATE